MSSRTRVVTVYRHLETYFTERRAHTTLRGKQEGTNTTTSLADITFRVHGC